MVDYRVVRSQVSSWDVKRDGEEFAISNHAGLSEAKDAARRRAAVTGGGRVLVREAIEAEPLERDREDLARALVGLVLCAILAAALLTALAGAVASTGFGA